VSAHRARADAPAIARDGLIIRDLTGAARLSVPARSTHWTRTNVHT
jgi:hypothetical protein